MNTIDQKIVERARAKRKLEKMVIQKGTATNLQNCRSQGSSRVAREKVASRGSRICFAFVAMSQGLNGQKIGDPGKE